ncbi:MAG: hypothetical protein Athens071426_679 [Parcubacteria group bacterium Athens0714_26]|nr:MAG: hypothetical protein Athens071426_679 [Parcubacteria group bacterium Athens0714_26]
MDTKSRRPKRPRKKVVLIPKFNPMFGDLYLTALENFAQIIWAKQSIGKPGAIGPTSGKIEHIKFLASFEAFQLQTDWPCEVCGRMVCKYFGRLNEKDLNACCEGFKRNSHEGTVLYPLSLGVFLRKEFSSSSAQKELSNFFKRIFNLEKASAEDIYNFLVSQCSPKNV